MEFTSQEILKATNNFSSDKKIGTGGFGCVYCAEVRYTTAGVKLLTQVCRALCSSHSFDPC